MSEAEEYIDDCYGDDPVEWCNLCDGDGIIVTCVDDMCRGAGECMHGDGEQLCPNGCDPY